MDDNHVFDKTRLCKFFLKGDCRHGLQCTFAHSEDDLLPKPLFFKTQLCSDFLSGRCLCSESECRFAHSEEERRKSVKNPRVKSRPSSDETSDGAVGILSACILPDDTSMSELPRTSSDASGGGYDVGEAAKSDEDSMRPTATGLEDSTDSTLAHSDPSSSQNDDTTPEDIEPLDGQDWFLGSLGVHPIVVKHTFLHFEYTSELGPHPILRRSASMPTLSRCRISRTSSC